MAKTVSIQIRINADLKKQATELFKELGLDMSSAVNLFFASMRITWRPSFCS